MTDNGERTNVEFKARCVDLNRIREVLKTLDSTRVGIDTQVDTYFRSAHGRLKLREGRIENALIFYDRPDGVEPKKSDVKLYRAGEQAVLKSVLASALGIDVVVRKTREIHFVENVKIHIDSVDQLGTFIEVEAIDKDGNRTLNALKDQCQDFMRLFSVNAADLVDVSYSDLLRSVLTERL